MALAGYRIQFIWNKCTDDGGGGGDAKCFRPAWSCLDVITGAVRGINAVRVENYRLVAIVELHYCCLIVTNFLFLLFDLKRKKSK